MREVVSFIDSVLLRLPLIGFHFPKICDCTVCSNIGVFGPSRQSLCYLPCRCPATVTGNIVIEQSIKKVATEVQDGKPLSETLRASGVFPPMVTQMIKVGESTGSLDTMLEKIADLFEQEVDRVVATLTSVLEPLRHRRCRQWDCACCCRHVSSHFFHWIGHWIERRINQ